jgi:hypothetical protein
VWKLLKITVDIVSSTHCLNYYSNNLCINASQNELLMTSQIAKFHDFIHLNPNLICHVHLINSSIIRPSAGMHRTRDYITYIWLLVGM